MGHVSEQSNAVALADIDRPIASTDSYTHLSALLRKFKIKGTYQDTIHLGDLLITSVDCLKATYALCTCR